MTDGTRRSPAEDLLAELAPRVLGALMRRFGDFSSAEDAVQEALLAAAVQWPRDGVPENPRGSFTTCSRMNARRRDFSRSCS